MNYLYTMSEDDFVKEMARLLRKPDHTAGYIKFLIGNWVYCNAK